VLLLFFSGIAVKAQFNEVIDTGYIKVVDTLLVEDSFIYNGEIDSLQVDTIELLSDSIVEKVVFHGDTLTQEIISDDSSSDFVNQNIDLTAKYQHSPHKASIYAAVFPGAGQIYNKKYLKVPVLYAGIGGILYAIHFNSDYYNRYRSAYRDFLIRDPGNISYTEFIPPGLDIEDVHGQYEEWFERALQNKRRYYKRYRDLSYIGMAALYLASIIDATVDAHFYNFDVSDDLSMRVEPAAISPVSDQGSAFGLLMRFQF